MPDIRSVKFSQELKCKCGNVLSRSSIRSIGPNVDIVCTACHASVLEIELDQPEDKEWD